MRQAKPPNNTLLYVGIAITCLLLAYSLYLFITNLSSQLSFSAEEELNASSNLTFQEPTARSCFTKNNFTAPIFLYRRNCPYSQQAYPLVEELVSEGYEIQFVDADDIGSLALISSCTDMRNVVPQYICIEDGSVLEGAVDMEQLRLFYDNCLHK